MKIAYIILINCIICATTLAQQTRTLKLDIVERKGNAKVYAFCTSNDSVVKVLPKKGEILFDNVQSNDTLGFLIKNKYYYLPVENKESTSVVIVRNKVYAYDPYSNETTIMENNSDLYHPALDPNTLKMKNIDGYSSLAEYMKGRIAGVNIVSEGGVYKVYIRGQKSFLLDNSALIILDGTTMDSFQTVNDMINVRDIKSVDVIKDGAGYGARGANGVVVITTKKEQ